MINTSWFKSISVYFCLAIFAFFVSSGILVPEAHAKMALGISWSESAGAGSLDPMPAGLVGKMDLNNHSAIKGSISHSGSDLQDYTSVLGEYQYYFHSRQNTRLYTGGGALVSSTGGNEDPMALYAPIGVEYNLSQSPLTLSASSNFSYITNDGSATGNSGLEFFEDVSLSVIYYLD